MVLEASCIHWWIINKGSIGHCKKCGATRDFEKLGQKDMSNRFNSNGLFKPASDTP